MKIVMFSITPLFPDHDMGGGQKHLRNIAMHLARLGHDITLLCTQRADTNQPFQWHERARVLPILPFKQPFPNPYDTPAYNIASIVQDVAEHLHGADRFYMHDGEFVFPYVYRDIPTVVSLRDNVYPETTQGAFHFEGHTLVVISEYARQFFLHTVGRFFPELPSRMKVIYNGIDWTRFKPTPPSRILDLIPVDPAKHAIVLHPHRPEETKGLWQTIEVVDRLVKEHHIENVRALVPRWLGLQYDPGVQSFYERAEAEIAARGLTEHFVFHPWVPVELLPEYYSLGGVMFSLGSFQESFGNAVYESYGCGTPAIAARISTHRELLPEGMGYKVDYGDHDAAARLAADILREGRRTSQEVLDYLHAHYRVDQQLDAYAETILNAQVAEPMRYQFTPITEATRYTLAPWCYLSTASGIYHDYRADYNNSEALIQLVTAHTDGFHAADATAMGVGTGEIDLWMREGYLVPEG